MPHLPRRRPSLEALESRLAPVVGALAHAPEVSRGTGYDGVAKLELGDVFGGGGTGTGSLLSTGLHLLTAAHLLRDESGQPDSDFADVVFELPTGDITLRVPPSGHAVHPDYTGNTTNGFDVAVLTLPDQVNPGPSRRQVAPFGADRYDLYRDADELSQTFAVVGYGRTGTGDAGSEPGTGGTKRSGSNRFDADANLLASAPFSGSAPPAGNALVWDFDNGLAANDALGAMYGLADLGLGANESNPAQGDSGGPLFLGGKIAGIVSYSDGGVSPPDVNTDVDRGFGEFGVAARVSSFAGFIDANTSGAYHLVLDLNYQPTGIDFVREKLTVAARRNGDRIELVVAGSADPAKNGVYFSAPLSDITGVTIRGSEDDETFVVDASLGRRIDVDGRGGVNVVKTTITGAASVLGLRLRVGDTSVLSINVRSVHVAGGGSADTLTLDGAAGNVLFTGGGGRDTLVVRGGPSVSAAFDRKLGTGAGRVETYAVGGGTTLTDYTGVEAVAVPIRDVGLVRVLYERALGRMPTGAEVVTGLASIRATGSQAALAEKLLRTTAARTATVSDWITTYLGRRPRSGETAGYVSLLNAGYREEMVLARLLSTPEVLARAGGTAAGFVNFLTRALLGRAATAVELNTADARVKARGATAMVTTMLLGAEFRTRYLVRQWLSVQPRATATGLPFDAAFRAKPVPGWLLARVAAATDLTALRAAVLGSAEFRADPR